MSAHFVKVVVVVGSNELATSTINKYLKPSADPRNGIVGLGLLLDHIQAGLTPAKVFVGVEGDDSVSPTQTPAAGQVVISHASISDGDTLTIGGRVLTWRASPANENEVLIGANATADGDNLVTKLTDHTELSALVQGVNAAGTVAITARYPGLEGKHILMSTSDAGAMALTQMTLSVSADAKALPRSYARGLP
jgi:hypothetical protein